MLQPTKSPSNIIAKAQEFLAFNSKDYKMSTPVLTISFTNGLSVYKSDVVNIIGSNGASYEHVSIFV